MGVGGVRLRRDDGSLQELDFRGGLGRPEHGQRAHGRRLNHSDGGLVMRGGAKGGKVRGRRQRRAAQLGRRKGIGGGRERGGGLAARRGPDGGLEMGSGVFGNG